MIRPLKRILTLNTAKEYCENFEAVKYRFEAAHSDVHFVIADSISSALALYSSMEFWFAYLMMNDFSRDDLINILNNIAPTPVVLCCDNLSDTDHYTAYMYGATVCFTHMVHIEIMVSFFESQYRLYRDHEAAIETLAAQGHSINHTLCFANGLSIDAHTRKVRIRGDQVSLTAKEFALLYLLATYADQVLTQGQLINQVWDGSEEEEIDISHYISRLRKKLEINPREPRIIRTFYSIGYKLSSVADDD